MVKKARLSLAGFARWDPWWWGAVMGRTFMMKTRAYPYGLCPPGTQARSGCVDALGMEGRKAGAGRMHTKNAHILNVSV